MTVKLSAKSFYLKEVSFSNTGPCRTRRVPSLKRNGSHAATVVTTRADSRFVPRHWEPALLCNDVSHWQGANLELALSPITLERALHVLNVLILTALNNVSIPVCLLRSGIVTDIFLIFNTLKSGPNENHFADNFKCIFSKEKCYLTLFLFPTFQLTTCQHLLG